MDKKRLMVATVGFCFIPLLTTITAAAALIAVINNA